MGLFECIVLRGSGSLFLLLNGSGSYFLFAVPGGSSLAVPVRFHNIIQFAYGFVRKYSWYLSKECCTVRQFHVDIISDAYCFCSFIICNIPTECKYPLGYYLGWIPKYFGCNTICSIFKKRTSPVLSYGSLVYDNKI